MALRNYMYFKHEDQLKNRIAHNVVIPGHVGDDGNRETIQGGGHGVVNNHAYHSGVAGSEHAHDEVPHEGVSTAHASDGISAGAPCTIHRKPRRLTPTQIRKMEMQNLKISDEEGLKHTQ